MKKLFLFITLSLTMVFMISCKKDKKVDDNNLLHVSLNNKGETISNDIFKTVFNYYVAMEDSLFTPGDSGNLRIDEACANISISPFDTVTWPKTLTINFPHTSCVCNDGIVRSGQIDVFVSGKWRNTGTSIKAGFVNYYINGTRIEGDKNLNIIANSASGFFISDSAEYTITSSSEVFEWESVHTVQWAAGLNSHNNLTDDVFLYNGSSEGSPHLGSNPVDQTFNTNIISAVRFDNQCHWLKSGIIELIPLGLSARSITYDNSCLPHASVIIHNETYEIDF